MMHPLTELRFVSPEIGYGVFATARIPRGTVTWARCALDIVMTPEQADALGPAYAPVLDHFGYSDGSGQVILCWDHGRFMNHCCEPTCISPGFDIDVAVRDIEAGEQLTCDYAALNIDHGFTCLCGAPSCRHMVRPDDGEKLIPTWDALTRAAFADVGSVPQPLWKFVRDAEGVAAAARGEAPVPSCRVHVRKLEHSSVFPVDAGAAARRASAL